MTLETTPTTSSHSTANFGASRILLFWFLIRCAWPMTHDPTEGWKKNWMTQWEVYSHYYEGYLNSVSAWGSENLDGHTFDFCMWGVYQNWGGFKKTMISQRIVVGCLSSQEKNKEKQIIQLTSFGTVVKKQEFLPTKIETKHLQVNLIVTTLCLAGIPLRYAKVWGCFSYLTGCFRMYILMKARAFCSGCWWVNMTISDLFKNNASITS